MRTADIQNWRQEIETTGPEHMIDIPLQMILP